jgi:hypothetical protein
MTLLAAFTWSINDEGVKWGVKRIQQNEELKEELGTERREHNYILAISRVCCLLQLPLNIGIMEMS